MYKNLTLRGGQKKKYVAQSCQRGGLGILDPGLGCGWSWYDVQILEIDNEDSTSPKIILGASGNVFFEYFSVKNIVFIFSEEICLLLFF